MTELQVTPPTGALAWLGQALLYGLFALVIGLFSQWPRYHPLAPDQALITLSLVHQGQRISACTRRSAAELARLPPNMRAPMSCPRERAPVLVELDIDGRQVLHQWAAPGGLAKDGASSVYRRVQVDAGTHRISVRLEDSPGSGGFDYRRDATVTIAPGHILVIDFDAEKGGITLQ